MTIARRSALALPALALLTRPAWAAFPDRPVRIIVPFAAGTSSDFQARMIGERMAPLLRQPVIVENRAGAGGIVGADAVAKAPPDGYTLLLGSNGPLTNAPVLQARLALARKLGFAEDNDDHTEGISAIGIAFRDFSGEVFAISLPIPTSRFAERRALVTAALLAVKADLEGTLAG